MPVSSLTTDVPLGKGREGHVLSPSPDKESDVDLDPSAAVPFPANTMNTRERLEDDVDSSSSCSSSSNLKTLPLSSVLLLSPSSQPSPPSQPSTSSSEDDGRRCQDPGLATETAGNECSNDSGHFSTSPCKENSEYNKSNETTTTTTTTTTKKKISSFSIEYLLNYDSITRESVDLKLEALDNRNDPLECDGDSNEEFADGAIRKDNFRLHTAINENETVDGSVQHSGSADSRSPERNDDIIHHYGKGNNRHMEIEDKNSIRHEEYQHCNTDELTSDVNKHNATTTDYDDILITDNTSSTFDDTDCSYGSIANELFSPTLQGRETTICSNENEPNNSLSRTDCVTPTNDTRGKRKLKRTQYSKEDLQTLNNKFQEHPWLSPEKQEKLAADMGYTDTQIKTWFQNKRASVYGSRRPKKRALQEIPSNSFPQFHLTFPPSKQASYNIADPGQSSASGEGPIQSQTTSVTLPGSIQNVVSEIAHAATDFRHLKAQGNPLCFSAIGQSYHPSNVTVTKNPYLAQTPLASSFHYSNIMLGNIPQSEAYLPRVNERLHVVSSDLHNQPQRNNLFDGSNRNQFPAPHLGLGHSSNSLYAQIFPNSLSQNFLQDNMKHHVVPNLHAADGNFFLPHQNNEVNVQRPFQTSQPNQTRLPNHGSFHRPWAVETPPVFPHQLISPQPEQNIPNKVHRFEYSRQTSQMPSIQTPLRQIEQDVYNNILSSPIDLSKNSKANASVIDNSSPVPFNVFMDNFSKQLQNCNKDLKSKDTAFDSHVENSSHLIDHVTSTCPSEDESDTENIQVD